MTHDEKVQYLIKDLGQKGIGPYTVAPPFYRLLWRLGIEAPPPHFGGFLMPALTTGAAFGIIWGVFMWFTFWRGQTDPTIAVGTSVLAGCLFGGVMASYYQRQRKKFALPRWEDYPASGMTPGLRGRIVLPSRQGELLPLAVALRSHDGTSAAGQVPAPPGRRRDHMDR